MSDCIDGQGCGFTFSKNDPTSMFDACMRAFDVYKAGDEWRNMVQRAMRCDNSWEACALKYIDLYEQLIRL